MSREGTNTTSKRDKGDSWRPMCKALGTIISTFFFFFAVAFILTYRIEIPINGSTLNNYLNWSLSSAQSKKLEIQLNCSSTVNQTNNVCPTPISPVLTFESRRDDYQEVVSCPDYFKWIYEDLKPWKLTGITRQMVESAKSRASFRVVILNGRVYIESYKKSFQTRDLFTWWGILQLLSKYPGRIPDLEFMFSCGDQPQFNINEFQETTPPPLFQYCGSDWSYSIVFPDWTFWGWAEVNIKPWELLSKELREASGRTQWIQREPYAFWKGNPNTSLTRLELLQCNSTEQKDWKVHVYDVDWASASLKGFKDSDLTKQCTHRYMIYAEGVGWSVSQKYILACGSVPLFIEPQYYEFTSRCLRPMHHYWPIKADDMCRAIKFAVEWGNIYNQEAQAIGSAARNFIQEELKMDHVYDYMFNLLNEYAKLLKYKPTIPEDAVEVCSETMVCPADGLQRKFMMDSRVKRPADGSPCTMPPPFDPATIQYLLKHKEAAYKQVEAMEKNF